MNYNPLAPIVLVINPDPLARLLAIHALVNAGFRPVEARDTTEAQWIRKLFPNIRVVVFEAHIFGNSAATAELSMAEMHPKSGLVVVGGVGAECEHVRLPLTRRLPGPWDVRNVVAAVADILAQTRPDFAGEAVR